MAHAAASYQFSLSLLVQTVAACLLQMKNLRCFMYVSTAYSNAHLQKYSTVKEQLYPLQEQDGQEVDHAAIVDRLLAMPVEEAQSEVYTFCLCCLLPAVYMSSVLTKLHICNFMPATVFDLKQFLLILPGVGYGHVNCLIKHRVCLQPVYSSASKQGLRPFAYRWLFDSHPTCCVIRAH